MRGRVAVQKIDDQCNYVIYSIIYYFEKRTFVYYHRTRKPAFICAPSARCPSISKKDIPHLKGSRYRRFSLGWFFAVLVSPHCVQQKSVVQSTSRKHRARQAYDSLYLSAFDRAQACGESLSVGYSIRMSRVTVERGSYRKKVRNAGSDGASVRIIAMRAQAATALLITLMTRGPETSCRALLPVSSS